MNRLLNQDAQAKSNHKRGDAEGKHRDGDRRVSPTTEERWDLFSTLLAASDAESLGGTKASAPLTDRELLCK